MQLELLHLLEENSDDEHWSSELQVLNEIITKAVYQSLDKLLDVPDKTGVVSTKYYSYLHAECDSISLPRVPR